MDELLQKYILIREGKITQYDEDYIKFVIENLIIDDEHICLDCHGLRRDELKYFLEFVDTLNLKTYLKLITGRGDHSKKPKMDYYSEQVWKSPLKETIINYYVKTGRGVNIREYPCHISIRLK